MEASEQRDEGGTGEVAVEAVVVVVLAAVPQVEEEEQGVQDVAERAPLHRQLQEEG